MDTQDAQISNRNLGCELASLGCFWLAGLLMLPVLWFTPWVIMSHYAPKSSNEPISLLHSLIAFFVFGIPAGVAALSGLGIRFFLTAPPQSPASAAVSASICRSTSSGTSPPNTSRNQAS